MAISPESLKILKLHFRRLTDDQIAEEMNIDVKKVKMVLAWYRRHPEEVTEGKEEEGVRPATKTDRIIELYRQGKTHSEIAKEVGSTEHCVNVSISKIRKRGVDLAFRQIHKKPKDAPGSTQTAFAENEPAIVPDLLPEPQPARSFSPPDIVLINPKQSQDIHSLIDLALSMPDKKEALLRYACELEGIARNIRIQVGA